MNTSDARIGALSEIDRVGQAALDAIYAEQAHEHPEHAWMKKLLRDTPANDRDSSRILDEIEARTGLDRRGLTQYAMEEMRLGVERAQAVRNYIITRRILDQLGAL
ncbi:hypothetical protein SEA_ZANELLA_41 [Microbacterium phage Zanella]|nr:hypothetical protein SEA_ZANELLA_41 [Microbacterium phage Zanella]